MRTSGRRGRPFATRTSLRRKYTSSFFLFSLHRFLSFHLSPLLSAAVLRIRPAPRTSTLENIYRVYSRGAFSPPLSSLARLDQPFSLYFSLSLALLRFHRVTVTEPTLFFSLSLSLCLFPLFFPLAAPLSSRLCPFHVSRRGGGGGEEKVGKEEEGEQWD